MGGLSVARQVDLPGRDWRWSIVICIRGCVAHRVDRVARLEGSSAPQLFVANTELDGRKRKDPMRIP